VNQVTYGEPPGGTKGKIPMRTPEEIQTLLLDSNSGLQEDIGHFLGKMTVALYAMSDASAGEHLHLFGTGSLVKVANSHHILTAAHVWERGLKSCERVGITILEGIDHRFPIDRRALIPFGPPLPLPENEWGPDLVFLQIPEVHVGTIAASSKMFYSLDRDRLKVTRGSEGRVLVGAPGEFEKRTAKHSDLNIKGFYVGFGAPPYVHGDFDYVDLNEDTSHPDIPKHWGGVSGGGLWRVQVFESPETEKIDWSYFLEGVAFYQLGIDQPRTTIRCHALQSIRTAMNYVPRA
jgi:hypothetical protein